MPSSSCLCCLMPRSPSHVLLQFLQLAAQHSDHSTCPTGEAPLPPRLQERCLPLPAAWDQDGDILPLDLGWNSTCATAGWSSWCWRALPVAHHHCHCTSSSSPTLSCALFPIPLQTPICTNDFNCKVSVSLSSSLCSCKLCLFNGSYTDAPHQHFTRSLMLSDSLVLSILNTTHLWQKVVAPSFPLSHGSRMNL